MRRSGLSHYNPFAPSPDPERLLVTEFLAEGAQRVSLEEVDWRPAALSRLAEAGAATLVCPTARAGRLAEALNFFATNPVQSDYLSVFARINAVRRIGGTPRGRPGDRRVRAMTTDAHYSLRRIFKSAVTSRKMIQELIALMILAELIDPGEELWVVSPWISDVPLLDNRAGTFDVMNPEWGRREVRLVNVATQLMAGGSRLVVVTRPGEHTQVFLRCLREAAVDAAVETSLTTIVRDHLHTKGILTKRRV